MSSTDDRIVKMQFDNAQFKQGAAETKKALDDVNKAVDSVGKSKGLLDINANMQRVSVSASKMAIVTTTALATITNKAVNAGLSLAKSLTFDPIKQGFQEYESLLTKQNTIQNATGKSAKFVKTILRDLNHYSDQTVYSFGNMTDAITKFVNAGVPLKQSVTSIKGIANAAAYAGASSEEANRAMYAFSQSMSLGFIQLQDWNQIENANMGTVQFKQTLIDAAVATGTLTKKGKEYVTASGTTITATKGWRDGLKDQWATTEVLNKALGKYADTTTKLGKKAFESATKVRTFSAFMSTLKESIGSGWSSIFTILIGGLNSATSFWTNLSSAIGGTIQKMFHWVAVTLLTWRKMGGFQKVMEGFRNLLAPIGALFSTVGKAFRAAFPDSGKGSGQALYGLSAAFAAITYPLQILAKIIRGSVGPLTLFFQIIKIGGTVIKEVAGYFIAFVKNALGLIDLKPPSTGGMLGWIQALGHAIADTVGQISNLLSKGASLKDAFTSIKMPHLPSLPSLPSIGSLFGGGSDAAASGASASVSKMAGPLGVLGRMLGKVGDAFHTLTSDAKDALGEVKDAGGGMGDAIHALLKVVGKFLGGINFEDIVSSFNLAVLSTFMISLSRMFNAFSKNVSGFKDLGKSITGAFDSIGGFAKAAQREAWAKLILNIAIAIGILAVSLWILSKIPLKNLILRLAVMAGVFKILDQTMKRLSEVMGKMEAGKMAVKMLAFSVAITAMAFAMIMLATAMLIFNKVKFTSVAKGLGTMFVAMKLIQSLGSMGKFAAKNMIAGAFAIGIVAGSLLLLATSLLAFKLVDWESMGKAGVALAGVTAAIAALALIPYEGIAKVGLAMLAASVGLNAIAAALIVFALVKWKSIIKAIVVLGALAIALGAMMLVGGEVAAGTLLGISAAMVGLAVACLMLNKVDWASIGKLALVLGVLLLTVAVGAAILAAFLYIIAPVSPVLMGLAGAFALLGLGLLAFAAAMSIAITLGAAGVAAFAALATGAAVAVAVFMQTLASEAPILKKSFLTILQSLIDTVVEAIPMIIKGIGRLIAAVIDTFRGEGATKGMVDSGSSWMSNLWEGLKAKMPMLKQKLGELLKSFMGWLGNHIDDFAGLGASLVLALLRGVGSKIGDIVTASTDLIVNFTEGLGKNLPRLNEAGVNLIADFLHSLANTIRSGLGPIGSGLVDLLDAFWDLGKKMGEAIANGIKDLGGVIKDSVVGIAKDAVGAGISWATGGLIGRQAHKMVTIFTDLGKFMGEGLTKGIQSTAASSIVAVASVLGGQIAVANEYISGFIQKLDQQAIAAAAKAEGLRAAAEKASKAAKSTKGKEDDKAANKIGQAANQADKAATEAERKAQAAKNAQDRREQFKNASLLEKAKMRSEDAQRELDSAKAHEGSAAKALAEADALEKQSKAAGVSPEERKKLQDEAKKLREQAAQDARQANKDLEQAKAAAVDALDYQKKAGAEAAKAFQEAFDADAKKAADDAAFEKMSDEEKAAFRRDQAQKLADQAKKDLDAAKKLAFTDIDAANQLAQQAMNEADQARQYLADAQNLSQHLGGSTGTVVDLSTSDAASAAMQDYSNQYNAAVAAAAGDRKVEFNQYNQSPEALSPSEIYRQTNNLFTYAVDKLDEATAA